MFCFTALFLLWTIVDFVCLVSQPLSNLLTALMVLQRSNFQLHLKMCICRVWCLSRRISCSHVTLRWIIHRLTFHPFSILCCFCWEIISQFTMMELKWCLLETWAYDSIVGGIIRKSASLLSLCFQPSKHAVVGTEICQLEVSVFPYPCDFKTQVLVLDNRRLTDDWWDTQVTQCFMICASFPWGWTQ